MASIFRFLTILLLISLNSSNNSLAGFTAELVHRDSPRSPLYNPLQTHYDRLAAAFNRSISRSWRFQNLIRSQYSSKTDDLHSGLVSSDGEYFMTVSLGTPPSKITGIADTGSDLTWLQCKPCLQCYEQKDPIFDSTESSTYEKVPCNSRACYALKGAQRGCDRSNRVCEYKYSYGDGSFTRGNIAKEKLSVESSLGNPVSFSGFVFGCGHENGGTFENTGSGIVGLGGGSLSLISQIGKAMGRRFSYCLSHTASSSVGSNASSGVINFGDDPTLFGSNKARVVSTPLVEKDPITYYYLTIEAISVGSKRLRYAADNSFDLKDGGMSPTGNVIIDSGTTLTLLASGFYDKLAAAVEEAVTDGERASDPEGVLRVCFRGKGNDDVMKLPEITVHFAGGDVRLGPGNAFVRAREDLVCLSMIPTNDMAIYGNLAQMGFLVGYDLEAKTVSFLDSDCSNRL